MDFEKRSALPAMGNSLLWKPGEVGGSGLGERPEFLPRWGEFSTLRTVLSHIGTRWREAGVDGHLSTVTEIGAEAGGGGGSPPDFWVVITSRKPVSRTPKQVARRDRGGHSIQVHDRDEEWKVTPVASESCNHGSSSWRFEVPASKQRK